MFVRSSVRLVQSCLELSIGIILAKVSLRSLFSFLSLPDLTLVGPTEPKILRLVMLKVFLIEDGAL